MSELRDSINEMRNMRESYNEIAGVVGGITGIEPDITAGKAAIAEAISDKGVQTSATDTLAKMADNVSAITQSPITINGGEMYAKQLYGSLTIPNYWNLYEVMANLLSDGRLVNYGGILLAEYYKGYDSLVLEGAGSGGAYVVSDKDSNGQFIMYTADTTHTWNTEDDGKGNRWVAYCFADEGHGFTITNTDTCPRSIHIGRHVGVIESFAAGRISEIVVTDGNKLDDFRGSFTQNWNRKIVIKNLQNCTGVLLYHINNVESIYVSGEILSGGMIEQSGTSILNSIIIDFKESTNGAIFRTTSSPNVASIIIKTEGIIYDIPSYNQDVNFSTLREFMIYSDELVFCTNGASKFPSTSVVYLNYISNDKEKKVKFIKSYTRFEKWTDVLDLRLKNGWCKPLDISLFSGLTKQNVIDHIFSRLGVNDISTGSVTITLAASVLALFTQEEIDAVVERTNITIVGA